MYNLRIIKYGCETQIRIYEKVYINRKSTKKDHEDNPLKEDTKDLKNMDKEALEDLIKKTVADQERSIAGSLSRTINTVYGLTRSNTWDYFVTLTFDQKKVSRYDYSACCKKLKSFLDYTRRSNPDMGYVVVPEMHKDGAFHFHGLFNNLPNVNMVDSGVYSFSGGITIRRDYLNEDQMSKGRLIYNMERYAFGHSDIQPVEHSGKSANYITKYLTKELVAATKSKKRYWASRNLNQPEIEEHYFTPNEIKDLLTLLDDRIVYDKTVAIDNGMYKNKTRYVEIKPRDLETIAKGVAV